MSLTDKEQEELIDHLAAFINDRWKKEEACTATFGAGAGLDERVSRELIETFLDFCEQRKIVPYQDAKATACLVEIKRMLRRVLEVDMNVSANRKGGLPKAMGLVCRRDAEDRIRDRVIYYAYECAYDNGVPGRTHEECAGLIASALEKSGKLGNIEDGGLTPEKITKTYQRFLEEILGS
jgi:hypothetical protein